MVREKVLWSSRLLCGVEFSLSTRLILATSRLKCEREWLGSLKGEWL